MKRSWTTREKQGQVVLEFSFCMIVILLMIFALIMILRWSGVDLAQRRKAYDDSLVRGDIRAGVRNYLVPMRQLDPFFFGISKMNAVWDGQ